MIERSGIGAGLWMAVLLLLSEAPGLGAQEQTPTGMVGTGDEARVGTLTIGEAASRALETHPSVEAAGARRDAEQAGVRELRAARLPSLSLAGSVTQYEEPMVVTPIHGLAPGQTPAFDETLIQGAGTLAFTMWDGGARGLRIDAARSRAAASDASLEDARQDLLAAVVNTYLHALGTAEVLDAHDRRVEALDAELRRVNRLRQVGQAADVERLRVEGALASAEAEKTRLREELDVTERALARLVGVSPAGTRSERLVRPSPQPVTLPEREALAAAAARGSPSLVRVRREAEAASAGASVARSARRPTVELAGHLFNRGSDGGGFDQEWSAGLQISLPLFTGGAIGSRIARAEAESEAARQRVRHAELQAEDAVDQAISAIAGAPARVQSLRSAVETSGEVARIERLRLETGRGTQTDYLDAEVTLLEARAGLARAQHAEMIARVDASRVSGELTLAWIERNLESGGRADDEQ